MLVDLVHMTTRDGIRLDGTYREGRTDNALVVDAVILVHGTGGNFYSSTLFDQLADRLVEVGVAVLRVNTRGHDLMSSALTPQGGRRIGAAYELVDDCRHDLAAWIDWLRQRPRAAEQGPRRIGLIGHSLGGVKVLYALAQEPSLPVTALVALSPPRLSYSEFCASPQRDEFLKSYEQAELLNQSRSPGEGPAALLEVKLPLPFVITAAGYVEKYGPDERYNFVNFMRSVKCPTLVTFGSLEVESNMAFRGVPEALRELDRKNVQVDVVAGGDHFYSATRKEIIECVETWLRRIT